MDSDSDYPYRRGSDPSLSHPDFFEGRALGGPRRTVAGFLEHDSDDEDMPMSAASSAVLYPVGYTPILCKHGLDTNYCPECFAYPTALKSTGDVCEHFNPKKDSYFKKNSCRACYNAAMAYRKSLGLPLIPWGIFCKHGLNRHNTCKDPECKEGIRIYESKSGRDTIPLQQSQQAVSRFGQSPFASVFPDESGAQVFADPNDNDVSMGGGNKSYRKSTRKLKKKAKMSSRKARSYRKAKRPSRRRR